jgi:hypothetical protein|tara:strand:- start:30 stop:887 length:858 start_codon:yes stop_codon:yes gene_type:complete
MRKTVFLVIFIFSFFKTIACSCETPIPIIEFDSSEFVFEGKAISKVYAKDSLTYKITFKISKHYKKGNNPKKLEFELENHDKSQIQSSCDWTVNKSENWLVYAYYWNDKLTFNYYCSNSKRLNTSSISLKERKMLENGNLFRIENYIFENDIGFTYIFNMTVSDINSILNRGETKKHKSNSTRLTVHIKSNGNLSSVIREKELIKKKDSIFDFITEITDKNKTPISEFEKDAMKLVNKVEKWEIKKHDATKKNVSYIRNVEIFYNGKTNKWSYKFQNTTGNNVYN